MVEGRKHSKSLSLGMYEMTWGGRIGRCPPANPNPMARRPLRSEVSDVSSGNTAADRFGPTGVRMNALTRGAVSQRDNAAKGPNSASPSPQSRSDSYGLARRDARGLLARLFLPG